MAWSCAICQSDWNLLQQGTANLISQLIAKVINDALSYIVRKCGGHVLSYPCDVRAEVVACRLWKRRSFVCGYSRVGIH